MPSPSARRRARKASSKPLAAAEATIVLPKPGVAAVLPPPAAPEAEHVPDAPKPKMPPGTKRAPTLEQLKARAVKANKASKVRVDITIRIDVPVYEALIELAEEYHVSMSDVARQCLADGARKYRDFNSPYVDSPFRPTTPMRANPSIVQAVGYDRPRTGAEAPMEVLANRNALLAEDLTAPIPGYDKGIEERANASLANMAADAARRLGTASFLPQSSVLPDADGLAFDPLAPTADAIDPGLAHAESLAVAE